MKLSEVNSPFINHANYRIHVGWGYLEEQLRLFKNDYFLEEVPDFQRGHVWDEQKQKSYVEYILNGGNSHQEIIFNFPNFQAANEKSANESNKMVLVDGLQRLTAVRKFIQNELSVFGGFRLNDFEDKAIILRKYNFVFFVNNLPTRADVLKYYIQINSGGVVHSDEEIQRVKKLLEIEEIT